MHARTTALAGLLAAGLMLAGCSSSNDDAHDAPLRASDTTATSATPAPAYDPAEWDQRITGLISDLDKAQPACTEHPSSDACATALKEADETVLALNAAITNSGVAAQYSATVDHIQRNILAGYNAYIAGDCQLDPSADDQGSDCRTNVAQVLLGAATLPMKMHTDTPAS